MSVFSVEHLTDLDRPDEPVRPRFNWRMGLLIALCAVSAIFGRLCYLIRPFDSDGSMFIYMGRLTAEGGRFCHDLVDNKFPSVGLLTSVPWRLLGADWPSYVLLGAAMSLFSCAMLVRAAGRAFGDHARLPALLFSLVYFNFNFAVFGGFQLETVQAFFTVLAASAALEWINDHDWRDACLVGIASGCAAMCKPTGLAPMGALIVIALLNRRENSSVLRGGVAMLCGLLVPLIVFVGYLIRTDTLRDMPALWKQISRYAANSSWDPTDWTKPLTILILAGFPIFVRGCIFRRAGDRLDQVRINRPEMWFVIVWLILESAGVAAQRRMYAYHFLVLVPPVTLLFAMLPRTARVKSLFLALAPTALFSIYGASLVLEICYTGTTRSDVGEYIARHADRTDAVWKDDAARLWLETGCRPGSRFPMTFLFANYDEAPIEYVSQMLGDFQRTDPKYIILPAQRERWVAHQSKYILELSRFDRRRENFKIAWNQIFNYVDQNYRIEKYIGQDAVYRRSVESGHVVSAGN